MIYTSFIGIPISNRNYSFLKLVNGLVCERCNNGWMSQLEGDCQKNIINFMNKKDYRTNKELFLNNDNFVCFVDYNLSGETTLKDGGLPESIWNKFYHEKMNNIGIIWS